MEENIYLEAYLDELDMITVLVSKEINNGGTLGLWLLGEKQHDELRILEKEDRGTYIKYICKASFPLPLSHTYLVSTSSGEKTELLIGAVIRTKEFDRKYAYSGNDLGITKKKNDTFFKVWAPTATSVILNLYDSGILSLEKKMDRMDKGIWETKVNGSLEGKWYTFNVCVNKMWNEAVDPYAKAVTANGKYGVVIDLDKTKIEKNKKDLSESYNHVDAIIYETHIRDFTYSLANKELRGKYLGMLQETGISYLKNLGITHLQLLPIQDFEEVDELSEDPLYNWGYNPVNYNVPEGSYATDPTNPYCRIIECKQMISTLQKHGFRIIMDVVFNHVHIQQYSSFEKIVPGYYFRYDNQGMPSDGTGVGNDTASERLMMRKFMIDSVLFWAEEYGVDGFRFDLMGIHDIDTMNELKEKLNQIDPSIFIIGEGWNLDTPLPSEQKAIIENASSLKGVGFFNDQFRNIIKGNTFDIQSKGYALGETNKIDCLADLVTGSIGITDTIKMFQLPSQSVNYLECHDNHTMWDKMAISNVEEKESVRKKRQMLGISIILFSQGIPFLHSGMELFRTKYGEGNSYNSPDFINRIQWEQIGINQEYIDYVSELISIRKAHPVFRMKYHDQIEKHFKLIHVSNEYFGFGYFDNEKFDSWKHVVVFFNPNDYEVEIQVPLGKWNVAVRGLVAALNPLAKIRDNDKVTIEGVSTLLLFQ